MAPDLKIRDVDPATYELLQRRARQNHRSVEAELRMLIAEAVTATGVSAEDWESAGFDQVDEIVPGRLYEAWANHECYRIAITRNVAGGSALPWNSRIDMLLEPATSGQGLAGARVWIRPTGIAQRLRGQTPELALRDAMRWLAEYAQVDAVSRARDAAESTVKPTRSRR